MAPRAGYSEGRLRGISGDPVRGRSPWLAGLRASMRSSSSGAPNKVAPRATGRDEQARCASRPRLNDRLGSGPIATIERWRYPRVDWRLCSGRSEFGKLLSDEFLVLLFVRDLPALLRRHQQPLERRA